MLNRHKSMTTTTTTAQGAAPSNALHQCIIDGRLKQIRYFLKLGLKVNAKDKYGRTCLMIACLSDHEEYGLEVVKLLLAYGADLNQTDNLGRSVLYLACSEARDKLFDYLIDHHANSIDFRLKDNDGNSLLNHVCTHGSTQMVKKVLGRMMDRYVELDQRNTLGYTALLMSLKNDKFANAYVLLKHGGHGVSTSARDHEKCLNAIEWLISRVNTNKDTFLLNSSSEDFNFKNSFCCSFVSTESNQSRPSKHATAANRHPTSTKSWYKSFNQYFQSDKMCDHVVNPNFSVEHHRSHYMPLILTPRVSTQTATGAANADNKNNFTDEFGNYMNPKSLVEKLYELIYNRMSSSVNRKVAATTGINSTPANSQGLTQSALTDSMNMNLYEFESMRQTPRLIAMAADAENNDNAETVKNAVHSIFNMYDSKTPTTSKYQRKMSLIKSSNGNNNKSTPTGTGINMSSSSPKSPNGKSNVRSNSIYGRDVALNKVKFSNAE